MVLSYIAPYLGVISNIHARKTFEFSAVSTTKDIDNVIRGAFNLSANTAYELKMLSTDNTVVNVGLEALINPSAPVAYALQVDRTTPRLLVYDCHQVFLREPVISFSKIRQALHIGDIDHEIFNPLPACEDPNGPYATLSVQLSTRVQLKQIDNYGSVLYLLEITVDPSFGLTSSAGPSRDPKVAGWFLNSFTLQIKDDTPYAAVTKDYKTPCLIAYNHSPSNEISEISISSTEGTSFSVGSQLTPAPPYASLSATVGFESSRQSTTTAKNFNCTYIQFPGRNTFPYAEWKVELSHFLRKKRTKNSAKVPKLESFFCSDDTKRPLQHVPKEALMLLGKVFVQSYVFEPAPKAAPGTLYTYNLSIVGNSIAQFSAAPGNGELATRVYEDCTSTTPANAANSVRRIEAIQRTRIMVSVVPENMQIFVTKAPY